MIVAAGRKTGYVVRRGRALHDELIKDTAHHCQLHTLQLVHSLHYWHTILASFEYLIIFQASVCSLKTITLKQLQ